MKSNGFLSSFLFLTITATLILIQEPEENRLSPGQLSDTAVSFLTSRIAGNYGRMPLSFEANRGQTDRQVKFLSRGSGYTLFLTSTEAVLSLKTNQSRDPIRTARVSKRPPTVDHLPATWSLPYGRGSDSLSPPSAKTVEGKSAVLRMKLVGANPQAEVAGLDELPGKSNYFIGNDAAKWRTNISTYAKVRYENVYSGIDLVYYGNQQQLEYDFVIAAGADPNAIQFHMQGAHELAINADGDLQIMSEGKEIRWRKPLIYQEESGVRREIPGGYVLRGSHQIGFEVAAYDATKPLVIDPVLIYSTYLGGSGSDYGTSIAIDSAGNAYVTGFTASPDFPTATPLQPANRGLLNVFVAKLNANGSALLYSTYLGGGADDRGNAIAVDSFGSAFITGATNSNNFPMVGAFQSAAGGGASDAFVARLNANGSALVYSTYLGERGDDEGQAIAVDSSGNAYVTGFTDSLNFPTANPLQARTGGGIFDVFVTKLNPTGSTLVYSTYLGGSDDDQGSGIAVDSAGSAYVTGLTSSANFPALNSIRSALGGGVCGSPPRTFLCADVFVSKLNAAGSALVYSSYFGGKGDDGGFGIAIDAAGSAYVTGFTVSANFPTLNPFQAAFGGGNCPLTAGGPCPDAFVAKLSAAGSAFVYSTYLGGNSDDVGNGIAITSTGAAYITGQTYSTNFPTVTPLRSALGGGTCGVSPNTVPCPDLFVTKLNPSGSALIYSSYLGGNDNDAAFAIAIDSSGNAYLAGTTFSSNFPANAAAFQSALRTASGSDAFAFKVADEGPAPVVSPGGVVNGASFASGVAVTPGSIASIFGSNLAFSASGGVSVQANGIIAFLFYVSSTQINFQVPWEVTGQPQASLTVTVEGVSARPVTVPLSAFGPGIFTINEAGQAAVLIERTGELAAPRGSVSGRATRPANRGEFISIYCTGLGAVTNQPASGVAASGVPLSTTTAIPQVTIGGIAAPVTAGFFSGLAPGFIGLYQINVAVPSGVASGNAVPLVVAIGGASSKTAFIAVQ